MNRFSGKFVLRIPVELHKRLAHESQTKGLSLNQLINERLQNLESSDRVDVIKKVFKNNLLGIILFGSKARGEANKSSDEDLLVVLDSDYKISRESYTLWDSKISPQLGDNVSPQFVNLPSSTESLGSLWFEVALEGKVLFERDFKVSKILNELKQKIAVGDFIRKWSHGHPYWIRKEMDV